MGLVDFLRENWAVVMAAPWTFVTTAVLFLSIGFAVGRFFLNEQVTNLRSRIEVRDEEIDRLKASTTTVLSSDAGHGTRYQLIGRLTAQYLRAHPDSPRRMQLGLDEPPAEWINAELEKLGEDWRVKIGANSRFEVYDLPRWG